MSKDRVFDGKAILKRLAGTRRDDRMKISLYLSKSLYVSFKAICNDIPASQVMEELMREFIESTKR